MNPYLVLFGVFVVLGVGSRVQAFAGTRGWIPFWVGRKTGHIGFGALVLYSWTLFPEANSSRWFATVPSIAVVIFLALLAKGVIDDPGTLRATLRKSERSHPLLAPLTFNATWVVMTVVFWRTSPNGIAALTFLVLGDGVAELAGRTVTSPKLPWSPEKSLAGTSAAFVCGWMGGLGALWLFAHEGFIAGPLEAYVWPMAAIALVGALVESLPIEAIDNATVPLACLAVGYLVM